MSERWGGSELEGGYLPEGGYQIGGLGMRRRQVHAIRGGSLLSNLQVEGEGQGEECGLSHDEQNGKFCPGDFFVYLLVLFYFILFNYLFSRMWEKASVRRWEYQGKTILLVVYLFK